MALFAPLSIDVNTQRLSERAHTNFQLVNLTLDIVVDEHKPPESSVQIDFKTLANQPKSFLS